MSDWHWFASRLDVLGHTRDADNCAWGKYLAIHDPDGRVHHIAMPAAMTAGDGTEYRRILLDHGLSLAPGKTAREQLEIYLAMWKPKRRVRCVGRIGWHGQRFVLPDRTFGPGGETVVLQAEQAGEVHGRRNAWPSGSDLVAAPAVGNSRLAFAIAASFAGPLLQPLGQESGGFHFKGGSSIGKTSILHAARSTWGCALGSWRTTDNAAEATAAGACDTLHLLDEVSQADGRARSTPWPTCWATAPARAALSRNGAAREVATWRIMFLSTGELSLNDKIAEAGKRARAGQSVRVIDIPADAGKGLGVFDTLHGFASGAALADQLRRAGEAHSGHAARAFLEQITDDLPATVEALRAYMATWLAANTADQLPTARSAGSRRGSRSWPQRASWRRHWASCRGPRARRRPPRRGASAIGSPPVATTARRRSPPASARFARSSRCTAPAGSRRHGRAIRGPRPTSRPRPR